MVLDQWRSTKDTIDWFKTKKENTFINLLVSILRSSSYQSMKVILRFWGQLYQSQQWRQCSRPTCDKIFTFSQQLNLYDKGKWITQCLYVCMVTLRFLEFLKSLSFIRFYSNTAKVTYNHGRNIWDKL